jgi:hypothetical protein
MLRALSHPAERGARGNIATAQLDSPAAKGFSSEQMSQSERGLLRAFSSAPSGSIHPANPTNYCEQFLRLAQVRCDFTANTFVRSSFSRLAQVFYSDVPYRAISFILGLFVFIQRFILTRHFALHVVRLYCPSK